jgi:hypothetical protein
MISECDWEQVKNIPWFLYRGEVTTRYGVTYEEILDIVGKKNKHHNLLDKRRENMIDLDQECVFDEFLGTYVIR